VTACLPQKGDKKSNSQPGQLSSSSYNFGTVALSTTAEARIAISQSGDDIDGVEATLNSSNFAFKGGSYPGTGGTCGAEITATCLIVVTFTPTSLLTDTATITLRYSGDGGKPLSIRIIGTGAVAGTLTLSDAPTYDFGFVSQNTTADKTLTVSYSGSIVATGITASGLSAPFTFKGGSYPGTGGSCTTVISSDCTIVVTYSPTASGTHNQTLILTYNGGGGSATATRALQGMSGNVASLSLSNQPLYDFGTRINSTSTDATFTLTYAGNVSATSVSDAALSAPYSYKGGSFPGTGGTCTATVSANCTIVVTYNPTSSGTATATLTVSYNNGVGTSSTATNLTGFSGTAATLTISDGATYDFGFIPANSTSDKTFTVTKGGSLNATSVSTSGLSAPYTYKGGAFPGTGGTCTTTISATCTIVVTYAPTALGTYSQTLSLDFNDGSTTTSSTRAMTGTSGAVALLTISNQPTYSYGTRVNASSTDATFTVTKSGDVSATAVAPVALSAPFAFKGGTYPGTGGNCGATVAVTCTVVVTYNPTITGSYSQTLTLNYNNGAATASTSTTLTGLSGPVALLTISDGATYNFGTVTAGIQATKTFTVTNSGGVGSTAMAGAALTTDYSYLGGTYPGTGGTCSTTLNGTVAGGTMTCTIVVAITPTTSGTRNNTLTLNYNNGSIATNATRAMTTTAIIINRVAMGPTHACAVYSSGIVRCWGSDVNGQLGNDASLVSSNTPVSVFGINNATEIASGIDFSCARLSTGAVKCWGLGTSGQLGNGSNASATTPVTVTGITNAVLVAAGGSTACATLSASPWLQCWGMGTSGQLGNGANLSQSTPVSVTGPGASVTSIAVGGSHACAIWSAQSRCWGMGTSGQLGNSASLSSNTPVNVTSGNVHTIVATGDNHSCARTSTSTVVCWGANSTGAVGNGGAPTNTNAPAAVTGIGTTAVWVAAGNRHSCGGSATTARCWGEDQQGQIGDNASLVNLTTSAAVSGITSVSTASCGGDSCITRTSTGVIRVWGDNATGQLSTGSNNNREAVPVTATGF
jgi:alpha-tubulin suppressor-like RCC1 family protein